MNKEIKVKWLEALRSDKYKQGQGYLKDGDKFCCLGVLCDIAIQEGVAKGWEETPVGYFRVESASAGLPDIVTKWSGVERFGRLPDADSLVNLNDKGVLFNKIADVIEEKL